MFSRQRTDSKQASHGWDRLQRWYRHPAGQRFGVAEAEILREVLPFLFGYYLMALGEPLGPELLRASPVSRHWLMGTGRCSSASPALMTAPEQLPIATDSIDVLVLSHVLEFCTDPVAALKEVDRVLIPEGHALILGFNPLSLWGLWSGLGRRQQGPENPLRGADTCSVPRLRSWLALLGLEMVSVYYHSYRPPLAESPSPERLAFLETWGRRYWRPAGGGYVLLAKKRVSTLTPIGPRWFARRSLPTEGVAALYDADPARGHDVRTQGCSRSMGVADDLETH